MSLFVDTSVWSLVLRREVLGPTQEGRRLNGCVEIGESVSWDGVVPQEVFGVARSPKLLNRNWARPAGAVRKVALNGSAVLLSLSAVAA